ncbi:right-handed parallel beta-helix repeat-containing protein [Paenibacillus lemnae]|uniref:ABC transporter substrate-binding protein n=1 Tax=Paenibacillus lemnae TaxID=1330551 RepID=A0A848M1Q2_PAELE|nr:NosD domain-containing protein [Paenibacillus lemnae]NMO94486.1 ABC transporter substrate-binding protein [Paenibacillus lemnae]
MHILRSGTVFRAFFVFMITITVLFPIGVPAAAEEQPVPLQPLIDAAAPGDTLILEQRSYSGPAVIDKPLKILGNDGKIVNRSAQPALSLTAGQTQLDGFTVLQLHRDPLVPAIHITSPGSSLSSLSIKTYGAGIYLREADDITLDSNTIVGSQKSGSTRGNALDLLDSSNITITGNSIARLQDGVYVEGGNSFTVQDNDVSWSRYGFHFMFTKNLDLSRNRSMSNVTGAMIMSVREAEITDNRFEEQNSSVNAQGLLLYDVSASYVARNSIQGNRVGIFVQQSSDNQLLSNEISSNFIGIQMLNAEGNMLRQNLFSANVVPAQAIDSSDNAADQNYWDSAQVLDLDGSGLSDLPYIVNPFFLQITRSTPQLQLLFHSPGLPLLEQLFPVDQERGLSDASPLLKPPELPADANSPEAHKGVLPASLILLGITLISIFNFRGKAQ